MRSPAWMAAYAAVLALLGGAYVALVFSGPRVALLFALAALGAVIVATVLALRR